MPLLWLLVIIQTFLGLFRRLVTVDRMQALWQRVTVDEVLVVEGWIWVAGLLLFEQKLGIVFRQESNWLLDGLGLRS